MSESKIQIKVGIVEFSGEGNQDWLSEQFDKMLAKVPELVKIEMAAPQHTQNNRHIPATTSVNNQINLSVVNVAAKLNCKSGLDVVIAAVAYIKFVQGKSSFDRDEILDTMKKATGYYKASYSNNLTNILGALVKNETLLESSANNYSLTVTKEKELNDILSR